MKKIRQFISKGMSNTSATMIYAMAIVTLVFAFALIFKSKFIADMLSPVGLKAYLYGEATGHNEWLSIAAFAIGTILFSGFLVALITNSLRTLGDRYTDGTLRKYAWKNHALFLGYDDMMIGTLKEACKNYTKVVVAVPSEARQMRSMLWNLLPHFTKKIDVVQCNRTSKEDLTDKACVLQSARIFIIGHSEEPTHDATNMKSLAAIAAMWHQKETHDKGAEVPVPQIMVYLRNQSTFSLIQQQGFHAGNLWGLIEKADVTKEVANSRQRFMDKYCEFFNFYRSRAIELLSENDGLKPDWHSEKKNLSVKEYADKKVHLVVIGMTEMGTAIVREVLKLAHPSGEGTKYRITMVDDRAYEEMHYFIGRTKELFKRGHYEFHNYDDPSKDFTVAPTQDLLDVEFEFVQCDVAHPTLTKNLTEWALGGEELLSIVICTNLSPKNMAVALYFPSELATGEHAVPIWVYQNGDDSVSLLDNKAYTHLHTFSINDHEVYDTATSPRYRLARNIAQYYDKHYGESATPKSWEETASPDRWSSIYNVLSMGIKLRSIGIPSLNEDFTLHDDNLKRTIDIVEHNRWVVEKLSSGFIPTDDAQHKAVIEELERCIAEYPKWKNLNEHRHELENRREYFKELKKGTIVKGIKIHDDIRNYEDLSEYTKDKDRIMLDAYIASINNAN